MDYKVERNKILESVRKAKDKPCMDCNIKYGYWVMQFDHRPGTYKFMGINTLIRNSYPLDTILDEIAKCDVVCANCHAGRTYERSKVVISAI